MRGLFFVQLLLPILRADLLNYQSTCERCRSHQCFVPQSFCLCLPSYSRDPAHKAGNARTASLCSGRARLSKGVAKSATLPGHHLPDGDLALEDKACPVRCEVLLCEFGLD
jgi:hypothetical protein